MIDNILIFLLVTWIILLYYQLFCKDRKYLGVTSSYKLELKRKEEEIYTLSKKIHELKNLPKYEPEV